MEDLLPGVDFEHDAVRHLLTVRCDRLVVFLSLDFIANPLHEYISNLAQCLGFTERKRKLIPCLYKSWQWERSKLPEVFQHIRILDYERLKTLNIDFVKQLEISLQPTPDEAEQCPFT